MDSTTAAFAEAFNSTQRQDMADTPLVNRKELQFETPENNIYSMLDLRREADKDMHVEKKIRLWRVKALLILIVIGTIASLPFENDRQHFQLKLKPD